MDVYGKYHDLVSTWKYNPKNPYENFKNSLTRRNKEIAESIENVKQERHHVVKAHRLRQPALNRYGSTAMHVGCSPTFSRSTRCTAISTKPAQDHPRAGKNLPGKPLQS